MAVLGSVAWAIEGTGTDVTLPNPLGTTETVGGVIGIIIGALQLISAPLVALMVLVGGYQMLFSGGNPEKFKMGKKIILYAVIGYAILLIAEGVDNIITELLE